ncbi:meiosis-specific with OB domain-containing protein [Caerostris darwini]|uniref:Meiosis-specific with OB domain-containing protein n=1 Tax=Caerostris darwini TaxID=1538125 RepID=A0AAV4VIJ5_9ARAC|nr:meiosis-specific with OB domain-containing protein [Caerostris darwini]
MSWISDNYGFDFDSEETYQKVSINQLSSELSQIVVVGMIIAKQDARRVSSRKQPGRERFVLNFTLRDSPNDTINAICWGEESGISTLSTSFTIGDIVKIRNPQIIERQPESDDEKFKPAVNRWEEETANFIVKYCSKRSDIPDARVLYQYAMKISLPDDAIQNDSKYSDSTTVYTIEQIIKLMNTSEVNLNEIQGTLQVMISSFDIDSTNKISSFRCPGCIQVLEKQGDKCINGACEIGSGMKNLPAEEMYDIPLSLADNTGCIERCLLLGQVAENLLGLNVRFPRKS